MIVDKIALKEGEALVRKHNRMISAVNKALKDTIKLKFNILIL